MGQKVNPIGLRLGINKTWKSKWYVELLMWKSSASRSVLLS